MMLGGYNEDGTFLCIDECPDCGKTNAQVIDSRLDDTLALRIRRKKCKACGHRWNTVELCETDFACIASLAEARDITTLKQTSADLHKYITAMQESIAKLANTAATIDNKIVGKRAPNKKSGY